MSWNESVGSVLHYFNFAVCSMFFQTWVSTSEQSFSAPRHLNTYPTNTMKQDRLNSCSGMLVHCHKTLMADTIDPVVIAKTFASTNEKGRGILGSSSKRQLVCLKQETRYVWPVGLGHFIFFFICTRSHPNPPSYGHGRLSYVVFVVGTILKITSRGYKCQFSDNPIQILQNVELKIYGMRWRCLHLV